MKVAKWLFVGALAFSVVLMGAGLARSISQKAFDRELLARVRKAGY